jgi:hypothetical protein
VKAAKDTGQLTQRTARLQDPNSGSGDLQYPSYYHYTITYLGLQGMRCHVQAALPQLFRPASCGHRAHSPVGSRTRRPTYRRDSSRVFPMPPERLQAFCHPQDIAMDHGWSTNSQNCRLRHLGI